MADAPSTPSDHGDAPGPLTLIGTGHVLDIASKVRDAIMALRPDVVFVELDSGRLKALQMRRAGHEPPTPGGWLQKRLHAFQEGVAAEYGVHAGDEMLGAAEAGFRIGARVDLVDRPVQQTVRRLTKQITWAERLRLIALIAGGAVKGLFVRGSTREVVDRELAQYAADPAATIADLQRRFPTIHRVVIQERDAWMAQRIRAGLQEGRRGIAVVGDGHVDGLLALLDDLDVEVHRLTDVQAGRLPRPDPGDTSSVSVGFDLGVGGG